MAVRDAATGELIQASPLSKLPLLVAGDLVAVETDAAGAVRIVELQPRKSVLARPDHRGDPKPLAANLTHLAIVCAAPPGFDQLLTDQFCVAATLASIEPVIVINKTDLLDANARIDMERWRQVYEAMDYTTVAINTKEPGAVSPLLTELRGKAVALVGASGVGKSSIVQHLLPDLEVRVGALQESTGLGSHTTSVTHWYELDGEAAIVDSPGVRQFSVSHLEAGDVRMGYRDISDLAATCRFGNCTHTVEPHCSVRAAVESGQLAEWRYKNYCKLLAQD